MEAIDNPNYTYVLASLTIPRCEFAYNYGMTYRLGIVVVVLFTIMFLFSPVMVLGQGLPSQIVPTSCEGVGGCKSICDVATLAQNLLNTSIFIAVFMSALLFAYAGWEAVTAGGNAEKMGKARSVFINVLIGLIIILAGWVIIDTLMRTVTNANFGPWNKICEAMYSLFDRYYA